MGSDATARLAQFRADPGRAGVFLDFDGTLAPIVADPAAAAPHPDAIPALVALQRRYACVAIVSGRPVSFLAERVPAEVILCGLYGLERRVGDEIVVHPGALGWRPVLDEVAGLAETEGPKGIDVEHKGWSITLHFRRHDQAADATRVWAEQVATSTGLHVRPAKKSVELHPPVAVDKGTVVVELSEGLGAACFVGDDAGDLPAFDALDRLAAAGSMTLRVAVRTSEAPPELLRRADVIVDGADGVVGVLRDLLPS